MDVGDLGLFCLLLCFWYLGLSLEPCEEGEGEGLPFGEKENGTEKGGNLVLDSDKH